MVSELKPGTRVRMKHGSPWGRVGTVLAPVRDTSLIRVMTDGGAVDCCRHELAVMRDQTPGLAPLKVRLPYGKWTCPDGREVLFNRKYQPIWQRVDDGDATPADPDEWVHYVRQEWYFTDGTAPWAGTRARVKRLEAILAANPWPAGDIPPGAPQTNNLTSPPGFLRERLS